MFKSGPENLDRADAGRRIDHIKNLPEKEALSNEQLNLLGERQITFLKD